jgi:hypothetical protein
MSTRSTTKRITVRTPDERCLQNDSDRGGIGLKNAGSQATIRKNLISVEIATIADTITGIAIKVCAGCSNPDLERVYAEVTPCETELLSRPGFEMGHELIFQLWQRASKP